MLTLRISDCGDKGFINSLLTQTKLPVDILENHASRLYVAEVEGRPAGIAGFEFYGDEALLRSVAVKDEMRHKGLGSQIVDFMLSEASRLNIKSVLLLTETARDFFLKKGFVVIERSTVTNAAMLESSEFTYACPSSAVCMRLKLSRLVE